MDKNVIKEKVIKYFDLKINSKFQIHFGLKKEFKKEKPSDKLNLTSIERGKYSKTKEYYVHCLGNEEGDFVYGLRKMLNGQSKQIKFIIDNELYIDENQKSNLLKKDKEYRESLRIATQSQWDDPEISEKRIEKIRETTSKLDRRLNVRAGLQRYWESEKSYDHRNKLIGNNYSSIEKKIIKKACRPSKNLIIEYEGRKMNDVEFMVFSCLKHLNLKFLIEEPLIVGEHKYFPDFYLTDYNLIIEVYGDYWHRNPKMFGKNDEGVEEIRERDKKRQEIFIENGYRYTYFWENLIRNNLDKVYKFLLILK